MRIDAPATPEQKERLGARPAESSKELTLAGEPILVRVGRVPGTGAAIGGANAVAEGGWFAARPSGTENVYKLYAESFRGQDHLGRIVGEAQQIVKAALDVEPR